jgi:hypothetical protein
VAASPSSTSKARTSRNGWPAAGFAGRSSAHWNFRTRAPLDCQAFVFAIPVCPHRAQRGRASKRSAPRCGDLLKGTTSCHDIQRPTEMFANRGSADDNTKEFVAPVSAVSPVGSWHMCSVTVIVARISHGKRDHVNPNKRTAFSFRISGRTSSLIAIVAKSASQRSGVIHG